MSAADITSLVASTRESVDRMIEEEKAEKATERAARKAAAAAKNANAQKRVMPEGMTVVSKTGRSRTLNMSVDEATVSVDEARAASQQRLRSLMSGKQTPVSTVATVNDKGTLPHLPQYRCVAFSFPC